MLKTIREWAESAVVFIILAALFVAVILLVGWATGGAPGEDPENRVDPREEDCVMTGPGTVICD